MRIDTFNPWDQQQSEIEALPNENKTYWLVDSSFNWQVMVESTDEQYCSECYYMIGVYSKGENVKYQITIEQPNDSGYIEKTLVFGIAIEDEVYDWKVKWYSAVIDG